jgi:mercuric ion binding protein
MKFMNLMIGALALFFSFASPALAADQTVTLKVDNMTCASCPYMVKTALKKVKGVSDIKVSLATKLAVVKFDDAKTNIEALTDATFEAGFPSKLNQSPAPQMDGK